MNRSNQDCQPRMIGSPEQPLLTLKITLRGYDTTPTLTIFFGHTFK